MLGIVCCLDFFSLGFSFVFIFEIESLNDFSEKRDKSVEKEGLLLCLIIG